jgi:hypothetical protein
VAQTQHHSASSSPSRLVITTNQACALEVDGASEGSLSPDGVKAVGVPLGDHIITCASADGPDKVEADVTTDSAAQKVVKLDLKAITDGRVQREQQQQQESAQNQARAQEWAAERQQRQEFLHQFDQMQANDVLAWLARFSNQHLSLFWSDGDSRNPITVTANDITWSQDCPSTDYYEDGVPFHTYSNCFGDMPLSNLVASQSRVHDVQVSGSWHSCAHLATVTETTRTLPFIGDQTSTTQTDMDTCGDLESRRYTLKTGDEDMSASDYQRLALAIRRLAVLQSADLR